MKPSVVKVVNAILQQLEVSPESLASESHLRSWLTKQGYKPRDIDAALAFVAPRLLSSVVPDVFPRAMRQFALFEHTKLSAEARSAIARLEVNDLIEPAEREMIIDRMLQMEGEVDIEALDYLLSNYFSTVRNNETQTAMFNTFEGFGPTYH